MNLYLHVYGGQPTFIFGGGIACASSSSTEAVEMFTDYAKRRKNQPMEAMSLQPTLLGGCSDCGGVGSVEANCSGEVGDTHWIDCPTCKPGRAL